MEIPIQKIVDQLDHLEVTSELRGVSEMMCDDCAKERICKHAENCRILERDVRGSKIEDIITLEIKCREFMSKSAGGIPKVSIYPEGIYAKLP